MKVRDLRDMLGSMDEDMDVMIAQQPSWPLAARVRGVVGPDEREWDDDPDPYERDVRDRRDIVWLVAGDASEYAPSDVFDAVY